jgi:hypothetical protein
MSMTKHHKQLDAARPAQQALAADAARDACIALHEVRMRLNQERAMLAFTFAPTRRELSETHEATTFQSVVRTLREHPVGLGISVLAARVAIGRAMHSPA